LRKFFEINTVVGGVSVQADAVNLQALCDKFLGLYRKRLLDRVCLKSHLVKDHMAAFVRGWNVSLGFMSEQGIESLHAKMNADLRVLSCVANFSKMLLLCCNRAACRTICKFP
jgi:hypothetical protein